MQAFSSSAVTELAPQNFICRFTGLLNSGPFYEHKVRRPASFLIAKCEDLACEFERRAAADDTDARLRVRGVAVVDPEVRLRVLVRDDPEEEELAARQQHAVRRRILVRGDDWLTIPIPRYDRWRVAFGLAVQRRRFIFCDELILRMLDDPWVGSGRPN